MDRYLKPQTRFKAKQGQDLEAGNFSKWLDDFKNSLKTSAGSNVPCGDCTACCKSSFFIHIKPTDKQALAHIPPQYMSPAPMLPIGNMIMGFNEHGQCPMLKQEKCSIYAHRPETCRQFDCRVLAATNIKPSEKASELLSKQSARWNFSHDTDGDRLEHSAIIAAAKFLKEFSHLFPRGTPSNSTQLAFAAIEVSSVFLDHYKKSEHSDYVFDPQAITDAIIEAGKRHHS